MNAVQFPEHRVIWSSQIRDAGFEVAQDNAEPQTTTPRIVTERGVRMSGHEVF